MVYAFWLIGCFTFYWVLDDILDKVLGYRAIPRLVIIIGFACGIGAATGTIMKHLGS